MKATEIDQLYAVVLEMQQIKKTQYEFNFALIEIKKKTKPVFEEYSEKVTALNDEMVDLAVEYCTKDDGGKPVIVGVALPDGKTLQRYSGLKQGQQPEYDKRIKEISAEAKRLQNEEHDIDLSGVKIKKSVLPHDINGYQQEMIQDFIQD